MRVESTKRIPEFVRRAFAVATSGRPTAKRSASFACMGLAMVVIFAKSVSPWW